MGDRGPGSSPTPAPRAAATRVTDVARHGAKVVDHQGGSPRPFCTSPGSSQGHASQLRKLRPSSPRCECAGCGEGCNSVRAFDRHQRMTTGGTVRCLSPAELEAKGMVVRDGWWYTTADVWWGPSDGSSRSD